jgi:hypothetical protein
MLNPRALSCRGKLGNSVQRNGFSKKTHVKRSLFRSRTSWCDFVITFLKAIHAWGEYQTTKAWIHTNQKILTARDDTVNYSMSCFRRDL